MESQGRSCLWLSQELSSPGPQLLVLDCRPRELYESSRISGALSVALPSLMLRRLRRGSLSVGTLLPGPPQRFPVPAPVLLYDQGESQELKEAEEVEVQESGAESVLSILLQKLLEEGYLVYYLEGGFRKFQAEYPHLCEVSVDDAEPSKAPVLPPVHVIGLGSLSLVSETDSEADRKNTKRNLKKKNTTSPPTGLPPPIPVQILPNLYLGCARDSANFDNLADLGIRYILNVTPNLPNLFEKNGDFHYKQIPISDHWSQNLAQFFPEAITFIDEALSQNCGVLVHCLAGLSRSVTVTVAYLMQKFHLSLNDAYDLVKQKKSTISPNFNFMGQLLDFERSLRQQERQERRSQGQGSGEVESPDSDPPSFFTTPTSDGTFDLGPT